jgi:glycerol-3-phosphate dehydrogenase (NAD(P)+)
MASARENARYQPGLPLSPGITPAAELVVLRDAGLVVLAVPAQAVRETLRRARSHLAANARILIAAKGLERETGKRLTQVVGEELGDGRRLAVLSGPNLSGEIVRQIPTATVVATPDEALGKELQETFSTPFFRVYTNRDVTGVELGGALKNPIAIAAGISDGLGLGANTKASLLTRGLAEMIRLGVAAGARAGTFSGLSGLGDLMATAHSPLSRNYRLGLALGRGQSVDEAQASVNQTAEGVPTTAAACHLARSLNVTVPVMEELHQVLFSGKLVDEAVAALLARPYRDEDVA